MLECGRVSGFGRREVGNVARTKVLCDEADVRMCEKCRAPGTMVALVTVLELNERREADVWAKISDKALGELSKSLWCQVSNNGLRLGAPSMKIGNKEPSMSVDNSHCCRASSL